MTNVMLITITKSYRVNKAPCLDGFPAIAIRAVLKAFPDMFRIAMHSLGPEANFRRGGTSKDWFCCRSMGSHLATFQHVDQYLCLTHKCSSQNPMVTTLEYRMVATFSQLQMEKSSLASDQPKLNLFLLLASDELESMNLVTLF